MDALAAGRQVEASPADVARAVHLLVIHEREMASIEKSAALSAMSRAASTLVSSDQEQVVEWVGDAGTALYPDIFERWQGEGSKRPKTIAMVKASCLKFHALVGALPVEKTTKGHVIAFKGKLVDAGQSITNVNIRLSHISLLLGMVHIATARYLLKFVHAA